MNDQTVLIALILLLVALDLLTVAARSSLRSTSLARILQVREQVQVQSNRALALMNAQPRPYAGLHLAQSLVRFLLIGLILILLWADPAFNALWMQIIFLVVVGLVVAWLQWSVERRVARHPETWVLKLAFFIQIVTVLFSPLIRFSLVLSRDGNGLYENAGTVTEDELKTLVDAGQQEGFLEQEERQMIYSIFQLGDTLVREIMVPRIDVLALDVNTPLTIAMDALLSSGYSRVPVFEEKVDNVLGMLYAKDLLKVWREEKEQIESLKDLLREPYFVPEAKKVDELLAEMQSRRVHMAIVVDEYGGVAGVVTLEDIIEEIFGEIQDEYDEDEELPYQVLEDGDYQFLGRIDLDDFNQIMNTNLPVDEADTLGGFLYTCFGHVPNNGEAVEEDGVRLIVEQVSGRRIRKVRVQRLAAQGSESHVNE
ncbi:MAG: HlyC/CorC family transporter [Anaerolineales bacterium]|nr:HlyC/CorC family transporter [Anaerolineales bacterium]